jgi:hypothetical protein
MAGPEASDERARPAGPGDGAGPDTAKIDLDALADRVYRLMCREVRLDRARGLTEAGD